jgi:hypothetical protein
VKQAPGPSSAERAKIPGCGSKHFLAVQHNVARIVAMNGVLALVAATTLGIDVGWEPLPSGGFEYIIQIEPQTLESMKRGQEILSALPPAVRGMRRYRITVGDGAVPHEGEPLPIEVAQVPPSDATTQPANDAKVNKGARPVDPALPGPESGAAPGAIPVDAAPGEPTGGAAQPATKGPHDTSAPGDSSASAGAPGLGHGSERAESGQEQPSVMPPPTFTPDAQEKDLMSRTAGYVEGASPPVEPASSDNRAESAGTPLATHGDTPWLPLVGAVLGLFASLGANIYLGWNSLALRSRYRALVAQTHAV